MTDFDARRELQRTWKGVLGRLNELEARESNRFRTAVVTVSTTPYDIDPETDGTIFVDTATIPITLNFPTAAGDAGRIFVVKDATDNANNNNIRLQALPGELMDNAAFRLLSSRRAKAIIQSDGTNWHFIAT